MEWRFATSPKPIQVEKNTRITMKQYLSPEQTAKLIELGVEKPRCATMFWRDNKEVTEINYTIGELIEMLSNDDVATTRFEYDGFYWYVDWDSLDKIHQTDGVELIDALYDMIIRLKEEGVI